MIDSFYILYGDLDNRLAKSRNAACNRISSDLYAVYRGHRYETVSRFARNTVDSLTTIRKLKEHGTEVYFKKEAIWTFDSKGELLLTIMSSLAQEENRSISENITWDKLYAKKCGVDFDYYPRGRIVYRNTDGTYLIYYDKCIGDEIEQLSSQLEKFEAAFDEHYQCHMCNSNYVI